MNITPQSSIVVLHKDRDTSLVARVLSSTDQHVCVELNGTPHQFPLVKIEEIFEDSFAAMAIELRSLPGYASESATQSLQKCIQTLEKKSAELLQIIKCHIQLDNDAQCPDGDTYNNLFTMMVDSRTVPKDTCANRPSVDRQR